MADGEKSSFCVSRKGQIKRLKSAIYKRKRQYNKF